MNMSTQQFQFGVLKPGNTEPQRGVIGKTEGNGRGGIGTNNTNERGSFGMQFSIQRKGEGAQEITPTVQAKGVQSQLEQTDTSLTGNEAKNTPKSVWFTVIDPNTKKKLYINSVTHQVLESPPEMNEGTEEELPVGLK